MVANIVFVQQYSKGAISKSYSLRGSPEWFCDQTT